MSPGSRAAPRIAFAAAVGIAIGVATSFAQRDLMGSASALANSASPWLAGAFIAGVAQTGRRVAIGAGLGACVLEVAGYYVTTAARGFAVAQTEIGFWSVCAVIGGPVFGWAGWSWWSGSARFRAAGGGFLPATFVGEAIGAYLLRLHYDRDAVFFVALGAVLFVLVGFRAAGARVQLLAWTAGLGALGILLYGPVLDAVAGAAFGG